jgi:flagellar basal-body rod modification protein FlgD
MSTEALNNQQVTGSAANQLSQALSSSQNAAKQNELGKDAFIKMLVEQLKNQDPTEPIKNEDLAVNLAQFSQVEQLADINKKLGSGGLSDSASLAAFLGREVLVQGDSLEVNQGNAGSLFFELPSSVSNAKVEILDGNGSVVAQKELGALGSGRQVVGLDDVEIADGSYSVNVTAQTLSGETFSPLVNSGGVVTGFIPGLDPTLLIGNREVKAADIKLVSA